MSEEEKAIEKAKPVWWQRAKKYIFFSQLIHNIFLAGGILYGTYIMIENRIAEVLATPKRTTLLEKRDSVQFQRSDSSLLKHNGYFMTIFNYVDTEDDRKVRFKYTGR